jgi:NAD(P)-dependent dehydrogenase (short-subunit alcohol dehydrogenase family)
MDFPGVALITGAASGTLPHCTIDLSLTSTGIGKATALLYAKEGCKKIVIADVNINQLQTTKEEIEKTYPGVTVLATSLDVRDQDSIQGMVDAAVETFGRVDYCANVAGIIKYGDTATLPIADFDLVYRVNLRGIFLCAKAQINAMLKQEPLTAKYAFNKEKIIKPMLNHHRDSSFPARGAIVNVASQAGLMGNGVIPAYVATKHGVIGLSKSVICVSAFSQMNLLTFI